MEDRRVKEPTFEIKTIVVGKKELNRSVFRQIPDLGYRSVILDLYGERPTLEAIGKINYPEAVGANKRRYLFHFLLLKDGRLFKSACYRNWNGAEYMFWQYDSKDNRRLRLHSPDDVEEWHGHEGMVGGVRKYLMIPCPTYGFDFDELEQIFLRA
jgi:hypothetical protein